jgi:protocatechuate 4,5-dioxygenase beta chain
MARLVAAAAASHAPSIGTIKDPSISPEWRRVFDGFETVRDAFRRARPDVLVIVANDHLDSFFLNAMPAFAIGAAPEYPPADEGYGRPESPPIRGREDLGVFLVEQAYEAGFDPLIARDMVVDHGVNIVYPLVRPERDLPVVPVFQNTAAPPLPTARRCWQFGRFLAEAIARWPGEECVALIGTGGLAHQLGGRTMGWIAEDFDRRMLDLLTAGPRADLAALTNAEIEAAGNGPNEIRNWITVAAAVGDAPGRVVAYEKILVTGTGVVLWDLAAD